jgi:predicted RNA-binding Zn ribbon-like protein
VETRAPLLGEPLPVELMNTVWADRAGGHDALASPEAAGAWLAAVAARTQLAVAAALAGGVDLGPVAPRLRSLRDALRCLAAEVTDDPRPAGASTMTGPAVAVAEINRAAAAAPRSLVLDWRPGIEPTYSPRSAGSVLDGFLAEIAEAGIELFAGERRRDLRTCLAPGCVLYFLDKHRRREWCSNACGNRARVARHYDRHH